MEFWKMAFKFYWVTVEDLRIVVKIEKTSKREITPDEYEEITGIPF